MRRTPLVDVVFANFAERLPDPVKGTAGRLALLLELASTDVPWSQVFPHEFTLTAPAVVSTGLQVPASLVQSAVLAHMLGVLEGIAIERVSAGRISMTPELKRLFACARVAREEAMSRIGCSGQVTGTQFELAHARFEQVLLVERPLLDVLEPVDFAMYDRITAGKQAMALPASEALAKAAGWPTHNRRALRQMLTCIGAGLCMVEDVVDWEDAQVHGGAWVVLLARELTSRLPNDKGTPVPATVRSEVLTSGVLALLLQRAHRSFATARQIASNLGLRDLARWTAAQTLVLDELHRAELEFAGYSVRAKALRGWADTVLT